MMSFLDEIMDSAIHIGAPIPDLILHYWWVILIGVGAVAYMIMRGG